MTEGLDSDDEDYGEREYLRDRRFFDFVGLAGLPAAGTAAGKVGPCPARPAYLSEPTSLVLLVEEAWRTPYSELTCEHVRTLLEQKMALQPLAEPILDFAGRYPTATISNFPGEMGLMTLRGADEFLRYAPARFREWLGGDFAWMEEAFGWSRSLRGEAEGALFSARALAAAR